ncbi:Elongation factor Ts (EF-Ts) [Candidatus Phytoplasma mali]|uniref:Elongation factor Ts n=1 Tax=Phytoplasma mali (strain AT) TaxID=482235 RepID=EFTS_PHYMT|nr:translation elongation factor Ts [Candidatus Phytoplasma mali]B3QZN3.1 RecName: Full=Elongation factor Ts; Short=EF-Ts [Candidatus Phytoplasma mali AT]CAP18420.1 Elongation factor Ts (EF-Ts) [Candidatus Phytoplasma mali]
MQFDVEKIKFLRNKTQAGIMDCQKALINSKGDIDQAIIFLRKQGIKKASEITGKILGEGLTNVIIDNNEAVLYELNSETDFVAKNKIFLDLLNLLGKILLKETKPNMNIDEILNLKFEDKKIKDLLLEKTAIVQEKICLRKVIKVIKKDDENFGMYKHQNGFISVLVITKNSKKDVSEDIAMHIAANKPKFINKEQVDLETLNQEKSIIEAQVNKELGNEKTFNIKEKIIEGRLNKFIQNICLIEQSFVKNPEQKLRDYLKEKEVEIINYWRLEVGERI